MRGGRGGGGVGALAWEGKLVLSVSKFKRPLWRAARARTSVMFSLGPVFSNGSFEEEGNSGVDSFWRVEDVLVWKIKPEIL